tara:strand:- start:124 stop:375 length:252 start_codon:yes stop_codon:yes gene_type:complete
MSIGGWARCGAYMYLISNYDYPHSLCYGIYLFEEINNRMRQSPASVLIAYDRTYGFPTKASFDMDIMIADEEIGYYLYDFIPL